MSRRLITFMAVLAAVLAVAPAASAGHRTDTTSWGYGATTLDVDPGTLEALGSLGVTPGVVGPANLEGARYSFPIVNRLGNALRTGVIRHEGGISLTAGDTVVELTDFDIDVPDRKLYGKVNGAGPVALLDLDFSRARVRFNGHRIKAGPVGTTLTQGAADALNEAFGTDALTDDTVVGDVKIRYRVW
jgi:hypothetical protein